jgi:hypothetical protein
MKLLAGLATATAINAGVMLAQIAAANAATSVHITYVTAAASPGGVVTIKATAPVGARCIPDLFPPGTTSRIKLASRRSRPATGSGTTNSRETRHSESGA